MRGIYQRSSTGGPGMPASFGNCFPETEKRLRSDLLLFGVDPVEGHPWPKPYVYVFRSPDFAPEALSPGMVATCSIGKGSNIKTYCEAIQNLADDEDLVTLETLRPGGIVMGVEQRISQRLEALPISGISPHLHICVASRNGMVLGTNDRRYIGEPPETDFVMPPVARNYAEFRQMFGNLASAVEGAIA